MIPKRIVKKVPPARKAAWNAKEKALGIAEIAAKKKAEDVVLLHVEALSSVCDYYVLCTAHSEPQIRAIVESVDNTLAKKKCRYLEIEGMEAASWVLMDYNDVILHIFTREARAFYNLDRLWNDAPRIHITDVPKTGLKQKPSLRKRKVH